MKISKSKIKQGLVLAAIVLIFNIIQGGYSDIQWLLENENLNNEGVAEHILSEISRVKILGYVNFLIMMVLYFKIYAINNTKK